MSEKHKQGGGECPWKSVGAIVHRGNDTSFVLLIHRAKYPVSWAPPAGHLDEVGPSELEDPKDAVMRELSEEVGLYVSRPDDSQLVLKDLLENRCRRENPQSGARYDSHQWWVYRFTVPENFQPTLQRDEATDWRWANRDEIQRLIRQNALDPAWAEIFTRFDTRIFGE